MSFWTKTIERGARISDAVKSHSKIEIQNIVIVYVRATALWYRSLPITILIKSNIGAATAILKYALGMNERAPILYIVST
jgi:hypothetical protein